MVTSCFKFWLLISLITVALLSHATTCESSNSNSNSVRGIKQRDAYLFYLSELYKSSSSSQKPVAGQKIRDAVTTIAYLESRIEMLGLLLFGPENRRSTIRSVRDTKLPTTDDQQCLQSSLKLFEKYCGVLTERGMEQSLANICYYVANKAAIREAIVVACGMHVTELHAINVGNPTVSFTPAPILGSSQYCGRVVVSGVSRMQLRAYAKAYHLMLVTSESISETLDHFIQVCYHRNASLGLCHCKAEDWRSLQEGSWRSIMPPYDQRFIDVKFMVRLSGPVTITLDEVSQGWRYLWLVAGIALLCMIVSRDDLDVGRVLYLIKWFMYAVAFTCIFMSSIDKQSASLAGLSCFALANLYRMFIAPIFGTKTKQLGLFKKLELVARARGSLEASSNFFS